LFMLIQMTYKTKLTYDILALFAAAYYPYSLKFFFGITCLSSSNLRKSVHQVIWEKENMDSDKFVFSEFDPVLY